MVRYTAPCGTSHEILLGTQRIFLFLDRGTKIPTGDAAVTYESSESAKNAIDKFDQMNFNGHGIISVKQALPDQKNPFAEKLVSLFSLEGSNQDPDGEIENYGKSRISNFCYIEVIVFDISYLPVSAVGN